MNLEIEKTEGTEYPIAVLSVIEDIPGGVMFDRTQVKAVTESIKAGALLGVGSGGLYHLCKTAKMQAAALAEAVTLKVLKNHEFKVGDFITNGAVATAITVINTTEDDYDTLTITATLDDTNPVLIDTVLYEGASETSGTALAAKYTPVGAMITEVDVTKANPATSVCVRGTVNESVLPYYVATIQKTALPLLRFV